MSLGTVRSLAGISLAVEICHSPPGDLNHDEVTLQPLVLHLANSSELVRNRLLQGRIRYQLLNSRLVTAEEVDTAAGELQYRRSNGSAWPEVLEGHVGYCVYCKEKRQSGGIGWSEGSRLEGFHNGGRLDNFL